MFTGIITGMGHIVAVHDLGRSFEFGKRLTLQAPAGYLDDVGLGDSIALNGACMTVAQLDLPQREFSIEISAESLARTSGLDRPGTVNLEKALRAHDRLGGHIVTGHVDGLGQVCHFSATGESWELRILVTPELGRLLAYKGSVAINGVSLTVNRVVDMPSGCEISINLIPHTLAHTTLSLLQMGVSVNVEVDTVARYVERMLRAGLS